MSAVLTINTGSQSVRLTLFNRQKNGKYQRTSMHYRDPNGTLSPDLLLNITARPHIVAHRWVHGGDWLTEPRRFRRQDSEAVERLNSMAPLHNPKAFQWLMAATATWPNARHILIPDTGLYRRLPELTWRLPLPRNICATLGLRRYGFHGLAHTAMWRALRNEAPHQAHGKLITLQLGGGSSVTAWSAGEPLETSMGYSPLSGVMMSSRPGDLDPEVVLKLVEALGIEQTRAILNQQSGLFGVSAESADMRELLASDSASASLAVEMYCHRLVQQIGSYITTLGGLDALVFGGGIGFHSEVIRTKVCRQLAWHGVTIEDERNAGEKLHDGRISPVEAVPAVFAFDADEAFELYNQAIEFKETEL